MVCELSIINAFVDHDKECFLRSSDVSRIFQLLRLDRFLYFKKKTIQRHVDAFQHLKMSGNVKLHDMWS